MVLYRATKEREREKVSVSENGWEIQHRSE
jgi:hypothetical protein